MKKNVQYLVAAGSLLLAIYFAVATISGANREMEQPNPTPAPNAQAKPTPLDNIKAAADKRGIIHFEGLHANPTIAEIAETAE